MARVSCPHCGREGHDGSAHALPEAAAAVWARVVLVQASQPATIATTVLLDRQLDLWSRQTQLLMRRAA